MVTLNSLSAQNQHPVGGKLILTSTGIFDPVQINQLLSPQSHGEDNFDNVTDISLLSQSVVVCQE